MFQDENFLNLVIVDLNQREIHLKVSFAKIPLSCNKKLLCIDGLIRNGLRTQRIFE